VEQRFGRVAELLGWSQHVVQAEVLDLLIHVAGQLDLAEHHHRTSQGWPPAADPLLLQCLLAEEPGFAARPAPVRVDGALAGARRWQTALRPLGGFVAFGPRVAVVPADQARSSRLAMVALVHGFGVVAHHPADAETRGSEEHASGRDRLEVVHAPDRRPPRHRTWLHRLVEESLYDAFLKTQPGRPKPARRDGLGWVRPPASS
jgi:hypothetical protein